MQALPRLIFHFCLWSLPITDGDRLSKGLPMPHQQKGTPEQRSKFSLIICQKGACQEEGSDGVIILMHGFWVPLPLHLLPRQRQTHFGSHHVTQHPEVALRDGTALAKPRGNPCSYLPSAAIQSCSRLDHEGRG